MIGIYKITNKVNGHSYIGQSISIERRWQEHHRRGYNENQDDYNYPLYKAFRKYGISQFDFSVLEECSQEQLDDREVYWIAFYKPEYNQTTGGNICSTNQKLSCEQVKEIQQILLEDQEGIISHKELAKKYNISQMTIRDINVGRTWHDEKLTYPLHLSKFDPRREAKKFYCIDCGVEILRGSTRCVSCYKKYNRQTNKKSKNKVRKDQNNFTTREELKKLIRSLPFTHIAKKFNVSDRAVNKWCIKFELPSTKREINSYSDEEWEKI